MHRFDSHERRVVSRFILIKTQSTFQQFIHVWARSRVDVHILSSCELGEYVPFVVLAHAGSKTFLI